jgi:hypothetical protein
VVGDAEEVAWVEPPGTGVSVVSLGVGVDEDEATGDRLGVRSGEAVDEPQAATVRTATSRAGSHADRGRAGITRAS